MYKAKHAVYADFLQMKEQPAIFIRKLSIPLGTPSALPDLQKLQEGEQVTIVEPGSFQARGTIHRVCSRAPCGITGFLRKNLRKLRTTRQTHYSHTPTMSSDAARHMICILSNAGGRHRKTVQDEWV